MSAIAGINAAVAASGVTFSDGNKWQLTAKDNTKDVTPFGATGNWAVFLALVKDWTGKVTAWVDASDTAQTSMFGLLGSTVALSMNVTTVGTPHGFTGSAILTGWTPSVDVQSPETIDFNWQGTGPLAWF